MLMRKIFEHKIVILFSTHQFQHVFWLLKKTLVLVEIPKEDPEIFDRVCGGEVSSPI